ncbi:MAG: NUDIX domain-containing protein [Nocardioides sp.]
MRFASVLLVDGRGWLLLQERDEYAVLDPEKWGFVGGGVEPGESYCQAAHRELHEETGIAAHDLRSFGQFDVCHQIGCGGDNRDRQMRRDRFELFAAGTELTDSDIRLGEGRRIVFVDPVVALCLDLTAGAAVALPGFLASLTYSVMFSPPVA